MVCIYCGSATDVTNSRHQKQVNHIWRRRRCRSCHAVFTSHERLDYSQSVVVRQEDSRSLVPFWRDKLFLSIYSSCQHRPTAIQDAAALTDTVVAKVVLQVVEGTIDVSLLARTTVDVLSRFDKAAAVHYRAFHPAK